MKYDVLEKVSQQNEISKIKPIEESSWRVTSVLRNLDFLFGILCLCFIVMTPQVLEQFTTKPANSQIVLIGLEAIVLVSTLLLLDFQYLPANYISLIFQRAFILMDTKYYKQVHFFEFAAFQKPTFESPVMSLSLSTLSLSLWYLFTAAMILLSTFLTKIDISRWNGTCMVGSVATSIWTTVVLLSAMTMESVGREKHRAMCEAWTYLCAVMTLFILVFTGQRVIERIMNRMKQEEFMHTLYESAIFLISVYIGVHYIPAIHPGFSFANIIRDEGPKRFLKLIPNDLFRVVFDDSYFPSVLYTINTILEKWFMASPNALCAVFYPAGHESCTTANIQHYGA